MKNINNFFLCCIASSLVGLSAVKAQSSPPQGSKATIGIQGVKATDAIREAVIKQGEGKSISLDRVCDSMNQQLLDRIHNTRKFQVVSRGDLETILKDQDLQKVFSNPSDTNVAEAFKIAGCKYALIVTVDSFEDKVEHLRSEGGGIRASKRTISLSAVTKIYDTTTGALLETASFRLASNDAQRRQSGVASDGSTGDQLLTEMAQEMSDKAANRVVDVIYPAKIIAMTGKIVTVNRGDGTGIAKEQLWEVYALGEEMIDPDTGEVLGSEEIAVGKLKIIDVTPKFSRGQILEDYGVDKMQIIRPAK